MPTTPERRGADLLVDQLVAEGVEVVFGLPGIQLMALFDALYVRRDEIKVIHARHEQTCGYMAYGYAKATGRVGVVIVAPGPGSLNAAAAVGTAFACNAPLLVLSGEIPRAQIGMGRGYLHEIDDQLDCVRPITKSATRVTSADEIARAVRDGMTHALDGRQRPVWIAIPPEVLGERTRGDTLPPVRRPRVAAAPAAIEQAAAVLAEARSPAIFAGGGALAADAGPEVSALADLLQAPILTTQNAKGLVPEDDPRCVGVTYYEQLGPGYSILPRSDVILGVGSRLLIRGLSLRPEQRLVHVDIDPGEMGRSLRPAVPVVGDAKASLTSLVRILSGRGVAQPSRRDAIAEDKQKFAAEVRALAPEQSRVIDLLRGTLARDAVVVSGMNNIGYWSHLGFVAYEPRTYLTPGYFGTLGYAFPTALGAKVAHPTRQVVALCGDGGFLFAGSELATAVQFALDVVIVVFNNDSYGANEWDQICLYEGRKLATRLSNPDFVRYAESFGAVGMRAQPDELDGAVAAALATRRPTVIEVPFSGQLTPFRIPSQLRAPGPIQEDQPR